MADFFLYWRPETVEVHFSRHFLLLHAGSNQLGRVLAGDTLWIGTTAEGFEVGLAGRIRIAEVVTFTEAQRRLCVRDLWPSTKHALADPPQRSTCAA
jgi:hypothetical protein